MRSGFDEADRIAGLRHARAANASGTDDATALSIAALVIAHLDRDYEAALSAIERALSLNASSATAHYWGAHIYAFNGNPAAATICANRALRLSPFDPLAYEAYVALALAAFQDARYDESAALCVKAAQANSGFSTLYLSYGGNWVTGVRKAA
jgi:tetratricopeptide (TPR) repeat protein